MTNEQKSKTQTRNTSNLVFFVAIGLALIPASFITSLVREKNTTKHLQIISGISYFSYWLANLLFELTKYYITGGIIILIILAFDKYESYLYALYLLYGLPTIVLAYLVTFYFTTESGAQNFIIGLFFIIGALAGSIIFFLRLFDSLKDIALGITYALRVVPLFSFSNGFSILLNQSALFFADNPDAKKFIELDVSSTEYMGMDLLYLGVTFIVFTLWLIIEELFASKLTFGKYQINQPNESEIDDEEVKKEIKKANMDEKQHLDQENKQEEYSIRIKNVEKTYSTCFSEPNKAVRNISFCLDYGDCFAMLGVNGAGKSTMFKCLTSEIFPEKGDIFINGKSISSDFENIRSHIGYCPQIDAIFEDMTVKENLEFYAAIKGIPYNLSDSIVQSIMKELNLTEYIDKLSGNLSGGNKRKLSVAIAMIGNPAIILLDEPSAGMDPEARRYMWSVIHSITKQRKKSSVILTTHSMEEAETLCQKMGILVRGKFKCFGSANVIKETYGKGFEIFLTLKSLNNDELSTIIASIGCSEDEKITADNIPIILSKLNSKLSPSLISKTNIGYNLADDLDKYKSVLIKNLIQWNYRICNIYNMINDLLNTFPAVNISEYWGNAFQLKIDKKVGITIGYLFGFLDKSKDKHNITEYSITQTSMEQIFNGFALQDDYNSNSSIHQNHKPVLEITKEFLNQYYEVHEA